VTLREELDTGTGVAALETWSAEMNSLIADGSYSINNILLRPNNEDPVDPKDLQYSLLVKLHLTTQLLSYNETGEIIEEPGIPANQIGFFGSENAPITIEAQLNPVPIPGSGILLLSGIAALIGYRRRGK
jgi:hypothetical protein